MYGSVENGSIGAVGGLVRRRARVSSAHEGGQWRVRLQCGCSAAAVRRAQAHATRRVRARMRAPTAAEDAPISLALHVGCDVSVAMWSLSAHGRDGPLRTGVPQATLAISYTDRYAANTNCSFDSLLPKVLTSKWSIYFWRPTKNFESHSNCTKWREKWQL